MSAQTNAIEEAKKALPNNVLVVKPDNGTKPSSKIKSTPELPMDWNAKLNAIKRLEQINANLAKFEATKHLLETFKFEENSNPNSQPFLVLKDSGYSGTEFKTYNVGIIKGVIDFITEDINTKIKLIKTQISEFELPKI